VKEAEEQSGFRAGHYMTDKIFCLTQLIEKESLTRNPFIVC
jgi:hypothetical protein